MDQAIGWAARQRWTSATRRNRGPEGLHIYFLDERPDINDRSILKTARPQGSQGQECQSATRGARIERIGQNRSGLFGGGQAKQILNTPFLIILLDGLHSVTSQGSLIKVFTGQNTPDPPREQVEGTFAWIRVQCKEPGQHLDHP